jgi:heme/copper-type cytochrome/quinol oxidase subunit 3
MGCVRNCAGAAPIEIISANGIDAEVRIMKALKHWQDPVNAVLGVWLVLSPWALGFANAGDTTAVSNMVIIGIALAATALGAIFVPRAWEEWTEGALGLWLIASPWLLVFQGTIRARNCAIVTGLVVLALALWTIFTDKEYSAWIRRAVPAR